MLSQLDYLGVLESAILIEHQCRSSHKETAFVREKTVAGEIVWEGSVEVFDLVVSHGPRTCYAWQHRGSSGHLKIFAIRENQFINSPLKAVQAALFADAQPMRSDARNFTALKQLLGECKTTLFNVAMSVENLDAAVQAAMETSEAIMRNRQTS